MPHSVSAKKSLRQNLRNRERNRAAKSVIRLHIRKLLEAISANDAAAAKEQFRFVVKKLIGQHPPARFIPIEQPGLNRVYRLASWQLFKPLKPDSTKGSGLLTSQSPLH